MEPGSIIDLTRDCDAVQIPSGALVILPRGTQVTLMQSLGGAFSVRGPQGMFSVAGKDADALGLEAAAVEKLAGAGSTGPIDEKGVWDVLRTCYDPEIPVNIVDLGLIYDLQIEARPSGKSRVRVKMTLTAPGCGMGTYIAADAQQKLLAAQGVEEATVEVVWDPPWHPSMISEEGRRVLGLQ